MTRNPEAASSGDPGPVLAAFRRALAREIHVLRHQPGLLWQQLHNRLQWEDESVATALKLEFERRSVPGAAPWFRTRTRYWESEALVRTLESHGDTVRACAFSPDGARVVSASKDRTLKLWDAETGECLATLELLGRATAVAHHPYGAMVTCGDAGGSIYLVDLIGITMGSLVNTAVDFGNGPVVRCPVCFKLYPLQETWLGREINCPTDSCYARLRVNLFVARRPSATPK